MRKRIIAILCIISMLVGMNGMIHPMISKAASVSLIKIGELDDPVIGKAFDTTASVSAGANTQVTNVTWTPVDAIAQSGKEYIVRITVKIRDDRPSYGFANMVTATVNGKTASIFSWSEKEVVVSYVYPVIATTVTTDVPVIEKVYCERWDYINLLLTDVNGAEIETEVSDQAGTVLKTAKCKPTTDISMYVAAPPEGTYNVRVRFAGDSNPWSAYSTIKTPKYVGVGKVTAVSKTNTAMNLSWSVDGFSDKVKVYRSENNGKKYKLLATLAGTKDSYKDKKVKNGKIYKYKVTLCKIMNGVEYEGEETLTEKVSPVGCPKLKVKVTYPIKIGKYGEPSPKDYMEASWSKVSKVTGYELKVLVERNKWSSFKKCKANVTSIKRGVKKFKRETAYDLTIRSYKVIKGEKYYSDWSKTQYFDFAG